ncbi:MAG: CPBP family intramembrane glutamic endopeptidase, partial [Ruminococcus sp.]|nr:CPBP family intramembrane glutamic endopeptidase [Ruminococcus sp.]
MKHKTEKKQKIPVIIIYSLIFYGVWALWELFGRSAVGSVVSDEVLLPFITEGIIKVSVWVLPAVCLVRYFRDDVYIGLKDMFTNRVKLLKYIPVYLGFTAYLIIGAFIRKGGLAVSDSFSCSDLIDVLFVGITEEMVFRGWLLNVTVSEKRKWLPIIINAVMFLLIHFPIWIKSGVFIDSFTSLNFLSVP